MNIIQWNVGPLVLHPDQPTAAHDGPMVEAVDEWCKSCRLVPEFDTVEPSFMGQAFCLMAHDYQGNVYDIRAYPLP